MAKLRCRPRDLARVVHSRIPQMVGRIVLVERFNRAHERWTVTVLGEASFGFGERTGAR